MAWEQCWLYAGFTDKDDYGMKAVVVSGRRTSMRVHRLTWEAEHDMEVPDGLTLDHICDTPRCVNPDHLVPRTMKDNVLRSTISKAGLNTRRTHCTNGHEFTKENTYLRPSPNGKRWRTCKRCAALRGRKYYGVRNHK